MLGSRNRIRPFLFQMTQETGFTSRHSARSIDLGELADLFSLFCLLIMLTHLLMLCELA